MPKYYGDCIRILNDSIIGTFQYPSNVYNVHELFYNEKRHIIKVA